MNVLLSIKPEFIRRILSGEKVYEFRKSMFKRDDIDKVIMYATKPIGLIVGEFHIEDIISMPPDALWTETKNGSGISKLFFDEYFSNKSIAYAIKIGHVVKYKTPKRLEELGVGIHPPQSYRYL